MNGTLSRDSIGGFWHDRKTKSTETGTSENAAAPRTVVRPDRRIIDDGRVIVSAGISAGIDMSLSVVGRLLGEAEALKTAEHLEYDGKSIFFRTIPPAAVRS